MRFSVSDGVVTVLTGLAAGYLLVSFWSDLDAITSRGSEPALGTVTFKKQTATRRSAHSQVWERLQNSSPVYESDTIRTADGSEAVIHFDDGLALDLQENTMLRLTLQGQVRTVDFTEGSVTLQGGGAGSVALGQSGRTLTLSDDAQLVLTKTSDTMSLELAQGTASVSDASGQAQTLSTLQALDLDTKSGAAKVRSVELVPRSPAPGGRLLDEGPTPSPVDLVYEIGPQGPEASVEVEVSDQPDFANPRRRSGVPVPSEANLHRASFDLEPGVWYWRVTAPGVSSKTRSFTLFRQEPPSPISPAEGTTVTFRKSLPALAFAWSGHDLVTSWVFELSRSPDFGAPEIRRRTTLNRLSIDSLGEGTWYWRVVPTMAATVIAAATPEVRRVSVVRRPEMQAIQPEVPVEGTVVQTQELTTKGLAFTWNPVAEARSYQLTARDGTGSEARILGRFTSSTPYLLLSPEQLRPLTKEGTSYWDLRWQDDEGNLSPGAAPRSLRTVDGTMALRPTYPPDGYLIAEPFITNTRFAWKSNLALKTSFQVSRDRDFAQMVYEAPADDGTRLGRNWGLGTFYWRLSSLNANGSVFVQTEPRRFDVLGPLEPAQLSDPLPGSMVQLPEGQDREVVWPAVAGADYYRITVSQEGEGSSVIRYQSDVEQRGPEPTKLRLPFSRLPEGRYLTRIQAFHRESELSTSIIGLYGESPLEFQRLYYPKVLTPEEGILDGLSALRRGVTFSWATTTPAERTTVVVRRGDTVVARLLSQDQSVTWPRVGPGDYTWTVGGTVAGFDLTSSGRFTVAPIQPLPPPRGLTPDQAVWGVSQLRNLRTFDLSWEPVPEAQVYVVRLYGESLQPVYEATVTTPALSLDKAKFLRKGGFQWTVEARVLGSDGSVEQPGVVARAGFTIDLPVLEAPQLADDQRFYGR